MLVFNIISPHGHSLFPWIIITPIIWFFCTSDQLTSFSNSWRSNRSSYSLFKNLLAKIGWLVNLEANGGDFCILRFPEGHLLPTESVDKEEWGPGTHMVNINVHKRKIVSFTCHRSYTRCTVLIQGRSATVIPMGPRSLVWIQIFKLVDGICGVFRSWHG